MRVQLAKAAVVVPPGAAGQIELLSGFFFLSFISKTSGREGQESGTKDSAEEAPEMMLYFLQSVDRTRFSGCPIPMDPRRYRGRRKNDHQREQACVGITSG